MRYQLCEAKGARICDGCARNVELASEAEVARAGPLVGGELKL